MTEVDTTTTFEEIASSGGHKDATMHVGGHGEPWPDIKVLVITRGEQTYVCIRRDGEAGRQRSGGPRGVRGGATGRDWSPARCPGDDSIGRDR